MGILIDALTDTARLLPLLAIIYFLVAFLEHRYGGRLGHFVMEIGSRGPLVGALAGCLPQCGFSVVASALYVKRLISPGTLLAVFLSTSDEALPVLLAMPERAGMVIGLIAIKLAIAIVAGKGVDLILRRPAKGKLADSAQLDKKYQQASHEHKGCCEHGLCDCPSKLQTFFVHPLLHTLKISAFLFIFTLALGFIVEKIGQARFTQLFLRGTFFQPVLSALVGLVPNCFASVFLANSYAMGAISFGSLVSGLCSASGLGILVLVKENSDIKDTFRIIGLVLGISIAAGILIQALQVPACR